MYIEKETYVWYNGKNSIWRIDVERAKYRGKKILIIRSENISKYYAIKKYSTIIIFINTKLNKKEKSEILHKALKKSC